MLWAQAEPGSLCGPPPCDLGGSSFLSRDALQVGLGSLPAAPSSVWALALCSHQDARCWLSLASTSHPPSLRWFLRGV